MAVPREVLVTKHLNDLVVTHKTIHQELFRDFRDFEEERKMPLYTRETALE